MVQDSAGRAARPHFSTGVDEGAGRCQWQLDIRAESAVARNTGVDAIWFAGGSFVLQVSARACVWRRYTSVAHCLRRCEWWLAPSEALSLFAGLSRRRIRTVLLPNMSMRSAPQPSPREDEDVRVAPTRSPIVASSLSGATNLSARHGDLGFTAAKTIKACGRSPPGAYGSPRCPHRCRPLEFAR